MRLVLISASEAGLFAAPEYFRKAGHDVSAIGKERAAHPVAGSIRLNHWPGHDFPATGEFDLKGKYGPILIHEP